MKNNFIHVCFIIDRSGSMSSSQEDVIGGYKSVIDKQKENTEGTCAVSLYTFHTEVEKIFVGKDIKDVSNQIDYKIGGLTAMNDAIGTAITDVGKWCADMPEEERPCKNMIVIMTDGFENNSKEFTLQQVKDMIKEQTEKYSWEFVYMGTDITNSKDADNLGINTRVYTTRDNYSKNYCFVNSVADSFRSVSCADAVAYMKDAAEEMNEEYNAATGLKLK